MVTPSIFPDQARIDGCTVSLEENGSGNGPCGTHGTGFYRSTYYKATATVPEGSNWRFSHFEVVCHVVSHYAAGLTESYDNTFNITDNPYDKKQIPPTSFTVYGLIEDRYVEEYYWVTPSQRAGQDYTNTITSVRAVFTNTEYTVTITASPNQGGIVTGGGKYGDGETCTLTAERNEGYELLRLEGNGTTIYPPNPPQCFGKTITHTFTVTKDSSWVAYFRQCTNAILRGDSGNILRGNGGNVLRDW